MPIANTMDNTRDTVPMPVFEIVVSRIDTAMHIASAKQGVSQMRFQRISSDDLDESQLSSEGRLALLETKRIIRRAMSSDPTFAETIRRPIIDTEPDHDLLRRFHTGEFREP